MGDSRFFYQIELRINEWSSSSGSLLFFAKYMRGFEWQVRKFRVSPGMSKVGSRGGARHSDYNDRHCLGRVDDSKVAGSIADLPANP